MNILYVNEQVKLKQDPIEIYADLIEKPYEVFDFVTFDRNTSLLEQVAYPDDDLMVELV